MNNVKLSKVFHQNEMRFINSHCPKFIVFKKHYICLYLSKNVANRNCPTKDNVKDWGGGGENTNFNKFT